MPLFRVVIEPSVPSKLPLVAVQSISAVSRLPIPFLTRSSRFSKQLTRLLRLPKQLTFAELLQRRGELHLVRKALPTL
jgi:hypothetical protein